MKQPPANRGALDKINYYFNQRKKQSVWRRFATSLLILNTRKE